jgi:hypothetical protein
VGAVNLAVDKRPPALEPSGVCHAATETPASSRHVRKAVSEA